jgi:hypothetical protein
MRRAPSERPFHDVVYYGKVQRIFKYCERGSKTDDLDLRRSLDSDVKANMFSLSDPNHLINRKDGNHQTPIYSACKNGNIGIV